MRTLSAAALLEKNKIASDSAWPILLEIQIPGLVDPLRLCNNNEALTWDGHSWAPFPFELDEVSETGGGELPSLSLRVANTTQEVQVYLEDVDGGAGFPVIVRVVSSKHLDVASPELQLDFVCQSVTYDAQNVKFRLGGSQALTRRFPERRYLKDFCPFRYGGVECGVSAATMVTYPTCSKNLAACRQRSNSGRFGGFPGIPVGGFYASV